MKNHPQILGHHITHPKCLARNKLQYTVLFALLLFNFMLILLRFLEKDFFKNLWLGFEEFQEWVVSMLFFFAIAWSVAQAAVAPKAVKGLLQESSHAEPPARKPRGRPPAKKGLAKSKASKASKELSPKAKAKAKGKAKAKVKAKAKRSKNAAKPKAKAQAKQGAKTEASKRPWVGDPEIRARNSRKSSAYHKARKEYLADGFSDEIAKEKGRAASWHARSIQICCLILVPWLSNWEHSFHDKAAALVNWWVCNRDGIEMRQFHVLCAPCKSSWFQEILNFFCNKIHAACTSIVFWTQSLASAHLCLRGILQRGLMFNSDVDWSDIMGLRSSWDLGMLATMCDVVWNKKAICPMHWLHVVLCMCFSLAWFFYLFDCSCRWFTSTSVLKLQFQKLCPCLWIPACYVQVISLNCLLCVCMHMFLFDFLCLHRSFSPLLQPRLELHVRTAWKFIA